MAKHDVTRLIENCRQRFEAGEAAALLDAIDLCARTGTVMPQWVQAAYSARYQAWLSYQAKTLDQAFGVQRPKGARIREREQRHRLKLLVVKEVLQLREQKKLPIDQALFDLVGEHLKIPGGTAREYYYDPTNHWRDLLNALARKRAASTSG